MPSSAPEPRIGKTTGVRPRPANSEKLPPGARFHVASEVAMGDAMPIVSHAQRGAMYSAAAGKSTLGIPKKVAKEFVATDKAGKLPKRKKARGKAKGLINGG